MTLLILNHPTDGIYPDHGRSDAGSLVASGVYFVRMRAGRFVQMQTMVLVK